MLATAVLSTAGQKGGSSPRHHWTDEEREIIRRDYKHTHQSRRELATRLGVTECAITGQIAAMGIAKPTERRPWAPEEKEVLESLIGRYCPRNIAHRMGRSLNSVVVMSKRMGLKRRARDGWYTKNDVCAILGVDHHWLQKYIENGELKATYHFENKPQQDGMAMWHIEEQDLVKFIRKHAFSLNGRNVDLLIIVDLLGGVISDD